MVVGKNTLEHLSIQNTYNGALLQKIINGQKSLSASKKSSIIYVQWGPKYAFEKGSTYIVPSIFLGTPCVDFKLFFLAIHTPCLSIFRIISHIVFYQGQVFHVKEKESYLLYDSHTKVIQRIISFFVCQKIQKSDCSDSVSHPFSWHMSIVSAIW